MAGAPLSNGHAGSAQGAVARDSTNPANYTASSHCTNPQDTYPANHSSSSRHSRRSHDRTTQAHGMTTFNQTALSAVATVSRPPTNSSSPEEIKAWVEHQLDLLGSAPLLNRFVLLGPHERRRGGAPIATSALRVHIAAGTVLMPCSRFGCF